MRGVGFTGVVRLVRRIVPHANQMSLKTRLRLFVILLMISVVSALSLLHLYTLGANGFEDVLQRSETAGNEVRQFVDQRVRENLSALPPERRFENPRKLWPQLIESDDELSDFLQSAVSNSKAIVELAVTDASGRIVADNLPFRIGQQATRLPDFGRWAKRSPWGKLGEIFYQRRDYEVSFPLGIQGQPIFKIKVVISSVLLREIVLPQIKTIALIFLGALLLSMLLAVAVSNLVLRPLDNISQAIDRISRGDFAKQPWMPDGAAKEFAAVQSKLNLLGQQYHGARQDAIQLRSNVEQLLERLEEVVLLFDKEDRLVMAGRTAERILGQGRWEIMGRSLTELFPPTSALGAAVRNAIELRQPLKDLPLTLEGGEEAGDTHVLVNVEMLEAFPDHQRIGTLITLRDAETRREIQSQLDVSARLAAISRLTGGVAHEIKNPLQAITVHLEVLKSKLTDQYDYVGTEIETIAREIQRLDRVVKTFLDFTRPVDLRMRDFEMVSLLLDVTSLVAPAAARQGVDINLDTEPGELFVHGDRDLLQQAILNVVVNGVEAMKDGGQLRLQLRREGDECCVGISDEGSGIPPEIREKIFNLYFSTKGKGSGIGLAMTFRVVQLHNGTIDFTSEPGKGTMFRLRFPAVYKKPLRGAHSTAGEGRSSR